MGKAVEKVWPEPGGRDKITVGRANCLYEKRCNHR